MTRLVVTLALVDEDDGSATAVGWSLPPNRRAFVLAYLTYLLGAPEGETILPAGPTQGVTMLRERPDHD